MVAFILDNLFWFTMACISAAGLSWTFARAGRLALSPQVAVLAVSRGGGVFLDIRSAAEYASGHIPRAQNVPVEEVEKRKEALAKFKQKPVVLICPSDLRGRQTAQMLIKEGFKNVRLLAGGMNAWREAQMPLFHKK